MMMYKWSADGKPIYGTGEYDWSGAWQPRIEGILVACHNGYHVCRADQVANWCGTRLDVVEVEAEDKPLDAGDKIVVRTWRWVRQLKWSRADMVDYAAWCAQRAASDAASAASVAASVAAIYAASDAAIAAIYAASYAAIAASEAKVDERVAQRKWIEERVGEKLV